MSDQFWTLRAIRNAQNLMRETKDDILTGGRFEGLQRSADELIQELDVCLRDILRFVSQEDVGLDDLIVGLKLDSVGDELANVLANFESIVRLELVRDEQAQLVNTFLAANRQQGVLRRQYEVTRDYLDAAKTVQSGTYLRILGQNRLEAWNEVVAEGKLIIERWDQGLPEPVARNVIVDADYDSSNDEGNNGNNAQDQGENERETEERPANHEGAEDGNNTEDDWSDTEEEVDSDEEEDLSASLKAVFRRVPRDRQSASLKVRQDVLALAQAYETRLINQGVAVGSQVTDIIDDLHLNAGQREIENRNLKKRIEAILTWVEGGEYLKTIKSRNRRRGRRRR